MDEPKIINVKLERVADRKLRMIAAKQEVSRSEIVRQAVMLYLDSYRDDGMPKTTVSILTLAESILPERQP